VVQVTEFNALPAGEARSLVAGCLGAPRWVDEVVAARPYADAERLRAANAAYEARFGHVFLIRAAGRSSEEILAELERRLANDDATEREETVTALRDIALLRLEKVVG